MASCEESDSTAQESALGWVRALVRAKHASSLIPTKFKVPIPAAKKLNVNKDKYTKATVIDTSEFVLLKRQPHITEMVKSKKKDNMADNVDTFGTG